MVEVVAVRNVSQRLNRAHVLPYVFDWSRAVLRACRPALRPTGLAGRICPGLRPGLFPATACRRSSSTRLCRPSRSNKIAARRPEYALWPDGAGRPPRELSIATRTRWLAQFWQCQESKYLELSQ
jgi:hypothetical protein